MRLYKLLNEMTIPPTRHKADTVLAKAGWGILGIGCFAYVYGKPGVPYVLKLFDNNDAAYKDFINLVNANPNPHFPKFHKGLVKVNDTYSAVRLEPLTPYRGSDRFIEYIIDYTKFKEDESEFFEYDDEFRHACDLIRENLLPRYRLDIKDVNLMMRGKIVVMTDPVTSGR